MKYELRLDSRPGKVRRFSSVDEAWAYVLCRYPQAYVAGLATEDFAQILIPASDGFGSWCIGEILSPRVSA